MRGTELLEQMALVDPAYVEAAEAYPKDKKRLSWKAVAAIVCVVLCGWLIWNFRGVFLYGGSGVQKPPPMYLVGDTISNGDRTVVYHTDDYENHIMAFTLTLERDVEYCSAEMGGYKHLSSWVDVIDGQEITCYKSEHILAKTPGYRPAEYAGYVIREDLLAVTVNGEPAERLPTKKGTYEIQIDYSKLYVELDYEFDTMQLDELFAGNFVVNCKRFERS